MKYLIIIMLFSLIGCGARKVDKSITVDKTLEYEEKNIRDKITLFLSEINTQSIKNSLTEFKADSIVTKEGKNVIYNPSLSESQNDSVIIKETNTALLKDSIYSGVQIVDKDIKQKEKDVKRDGTDIIVVLGILFFLYLVIFNKK